MATKSEVKPNRSNMDRLLPILLVVALVAFGLSFWGYWQSKQKLSVLTNPQQASELNAEQTAQLLEKVSKLAVLPADPNPVVATINDVEILASKQSFYKDAHNGDKLIVYAQTRKAIIFDEKNNKIVNIGPIFYTDAEGQNQTTPIREDGKLNVDIRNGSTQNDKAANLRDKLMANAQYFVSHLAKAANTSYTGITVVDRIEGDAKNDLIQNLIKELGAVTVVTELPTGEAASTAEVVVLLGN